VWDLETGDCRSFGPVEGAGDGVIGGFTGLRFVSETELFSYGESGLHRWNLVDGSSEKLAEGTQGEMTSSPDGRRVLFTKIVNPKLLQTDLVRFHLAGDDTGVLHSHGSAVLPVAFDPTGSLVVSGDQDGVVRVGPVSGSEPHLLLGHEGQVRAVAVSPDGRWIASAGSDRTIRLWPVPEGEPFHTLPAEEVLERLRSLTNLRVVTDAESSTGYRLDFTSFQGWSVTSPQR
jgi:WD40 repeat protein